MEVSISILDTFPSLNKLSQKNNLLLEYNNKEYNLKNIINQQDIFSIKENVSQISFKIYVLSNNNKILIGTNQLNIDSLNSENKSSITWLEFKKKIEENKKEINDINLLFYDCIRLKIKVSTLPAGLLNQMNTRDFHPLVNCLAHIINRESCHGRRRKRLHFYACFSLAFY